METSSDIYSDNELEEVSDILLEQPKYHNYIDILKNYQELSKTNKTKPIMTKYEKTKIIGIRAQQIASGAPPLIDVPPGITDVVDIAIKELKERKTPFILKRKVSNKYEYWKIQDLEITI